MSARLFTVRCAGLLPILLASTALAGPLYWDWPEGVPLTEVTLDGAALDEAGHLIAGLGAGPLPPGGPEVFWCIEADGRGGFYSGTGHGGEIHHTDARGQARLVAQVEAAEVFSLLLLPGGDLLAGCGPEGELLRIGPDGTVSELGQVPGGYVWAMSAGPDGRIWLATGSPAAVWVLDKDGKPGPAVELPAQNVLDLAWDAAGHLLASTQGPGLVYRLDPAHPDRPELLFAARPGRGAPVPARSRRRPVRAGPGGRRRDEDTGGRARPGGGNGNGNGNGGGNGHGGMISLRDLQLEVGPPRAALYRLGDDGLVTPYWSGETDLMIAAWTERWGWVGGGVVSDDDGRSTLHRLTPPAGMQSLAGWEGGDVMAILPDPARQRLIVCEAHPGGLSELSEQPAGPRVAVSRIVDAGRSVRWGRLRWQGQGEGTAPSWSVRSGNRAEPDADWSAWSDAWRGHDEPIPAPAGRYLQWRVAFPQGEEARSWQVTGVSLSAWRENLPPVIAAFDLEQVQEIFGGGLMPRGENVTQTLQSGLRVEYGRQSSRDLRADPARAAETRAVRTLSWRADDPDGDRLAYDLEFRRVGETVWRPVLTATQETIGAWDTAGLADGQYELRLGASDAPDNPAAEALRTRRLLAPVAVDNTPPVVSRLALERTTRGVRVRFRAEDTAGVLATATVVLPDGSRERLDPADLICDSAREDFDREVVWPREGAAAVAGPWSLRVEVSDLGGNRGFADAEVP